MTEKGEDLQSELIECELLSGLEMTYDYDDPDDNMGTLITIIALLSLGIHKYLSNRYNKY